MVLARRALAGMGCGPVGTRRRRRSFNTISCTSRRRTSGCQRPSLLPLYTAPEACGKRRVALDNRHSEVRTYGKRERRDGRVFVDVSSRTVAMTEHEVVI